MKMNEPENNLKQKSRKPYIRPKLTTYGSVVEMTYASTPAGMGDGAKTGATKS